MSTDPTEGTDEDREDAGGEVVQLRPAEGVPPPGDPGIDLGAAAPTREPIAVDYTRTEGGRRPVIPDHWRGRENVRRTLARIGEAHWYKARYHGLRSPAYLAKAVAWAAWGACLLIWAQLQWWWVSESHHLRSLAVASGDSKEWRNLHNTGRDTRQARGIVLAVEAVALATAGVAMVKYAPWWGWAALAVVALPVLARIGRPEDKPIITPSVLPAEIQPPTPDVIVRALGSLGIAAINAFIKEGTPWVFPSPVREDGPGWRAEVDLPYGVTATMVIERREQLASGLRRPLGAVWPEPVTSEHAGRLEMWVGKADISKAKLVPWPWLRAGNADVFEPMPFGTDPRGKRVNGSVIEHNWLIGSMPGQGKTSAVRVLACGAALDPIAELWIQELKGSGDLDPLERVSHRFVSGIDDESIAYAAESLKLLRREVMARTERIKKLPRELCPQKKVTRQIALKRSLKLWPIMCAIDECQNLFSHPEYGKQAADDAIFIIKIGRAFAIFLVLATQRPDKDSLPTGVSGNVSTRFCLKVAGQVENDMILGTSAYKNGARATMFRPKIDAGLGYLKGEENVPQIVKAYYLDDAATERVAVRARALREAAGTLSGVALGDDVAAPRDVLADVLAALGEASGEYANGMHWEPLAERLVEMFPERWQGATGPSVRDACKARGVESVDVRVPPGRDGLNRKGARRDLVEKAVRR